MSRQTPATVKQSPRLRRYKWAVIENSHLPSGDRRPRFDIFTIEVDGYAFRGVPGRLTLFFFNDRLLRTDFIPGDPERLKRRLDASLWPTSRQVEREKIVGNTRVWTYVNVRKGFYIAWEDIGLTEEQTRWIEKYA